MTTQPDAPADTTPDEQPPEQGATSADVPEGQTFNLSDEAAAALYPDVESGPPPMMTPDMEQIPPPFAQREGALLDIIRMYGAKHTDWPTTLKALTDFDYALLPEPIGSPVGPAAGQWYGDVEANAFTSAPTNSWLQLQEAADAGLLTQAEFDQVLAARAGQTDAQGLPGDTSTQALLGAAGDAGDVGGEPAAPDAATT